ncbi:hypothetical protein D3C72_2319990 [compost metagenome]
MPQQTPESPDDQGDTAQAQQTAFDAPQQYLVVRVADGNAFHTAAVSGVKMMQKIVLKMAVTPT